MRESEKTRRTGQFIHMNGWMDGWIWLSGKAVRVGSSERKAQTCMKHHISGFPVECQ